MNYKVISWIFEWHIFDWHEIEISKFDWSIETKVYDHDTIGRSYPIENCFKFSDRFRQSIWYARSWSFKDLNELSPWACGNWGTRKQEDELQDSIHSYMVSLHYCCDIFELDVGQLENISNDIDNIFSGVWL